MNILVVGSIALDTVETPIESVDDSPGGSALYFSNAASFFAPVNVVGVIGDDFDLRKINFGKNRPVSFDGVYTEPGKTFRWGGRYHEDPNKRDTLFTDLNVFEAFNPVIPPKSRKNSYVVLGNIQPSLQIHVLDQLENPQLVVCDTMNLWIQNTKDDLLKLLPRVDVLIINDSEARLLTQESNLIRAANKIKKLGPIRRFNKVSHSSTYHFHNWKASLTWTTTIN